MKLSKNDLYIGDIFIVKKFNKYKLTKNIEEGKIPNDLTIACDIELAKSDAVFVKVGHNKYIDLDYLKNVGSNFINECLDNKIYDNIILRQGNYVPKVGQLFIYNLKKYDVKKLIK